jgi:small ligand-binding sensory domain FIST
MDEPSKPSLCLLTGRLPQGANVETFSFNELQNPPPSATDAFWKKKGHNSHFLLADPWSPIDVVLERLGNTGVITGGISVPTGAGPTVGLGRNVLPQGSVVGMRFGGTLGLQALVTQGCRPVGPVYRVTECQQNAIYMLNNEPALKAMEAIIQEAETDQEKRQRSAGLVVGLASSSQEEETNDYLIRQIVGFVPSKAGIVVGGNIQVGDKFRFHVRDKNAAEEDMKLMVQRVQTEKLFSEETTKTPLAILQVSCVARGQHLFGASNVDVSNIQQLAQGVAIGGFYANGELGPVGLAGFSDTNVAGSYMHGFTTVATFLCEQKADIVDSTATVNVQEPQDVWE